MTTDKSDVVMMIAIQLMISPSDRPVENDRDFPLLKYHRFFPVYRLSELHSVSQLHLRAHRAQSQRWKQAVLDEFVCFANNGEWPSFDCSHG